MIAGVHKSLGLNKRKKRCIHKKDFVYDPQRQQGKVYRWKVSAEELDRLIEEANSHKGYFDYSKAKTDENCLR